MIYDDASYCKSILREAGSTWLPGSIQNTKHLWGIAIKYNQTECNCALKYCLKNISGLLHVLSVERSYPFIAMLQVHNHLQKCQAKHIPLRTLRQWLCRCLASPQLGPQGDLITEQSERNIFWHAEGTLHLKRNSKVQYLSLQEIASLSAVNQKLPVTHQRHWELSSACRLQLPPSPLAA